jgi:fructose/tagatose bisphosphate aldolase
MCMVIIMGWRTSIWIMRGEFGELLPACRREVFIADSMPVSRLQSIYEKTRGKVQVVLHGTNEFTPEILAKCIERGVTRVNANKLVLEDYNNYIAENTGKMPLTQVIEEGTMRIQRQLESWMDSIGSSGRA